jgi:predicted nucleic acid-binding protein
MKNAQAFWDSSVIVPLCCHQAANQPARRLLRQTSRLVVWWGAPVEVNSALSRLLRNSDISGPDRLAVLRRLDVLKAGWREISPSEKVRTLAEILPERYTLRAMDAFQLAAALVWCKEKPKGRVFVCADKRLSEAATNAGFTVVP